MRPKPSLRSLFHARAGAGPFSLSGPLRLRVSILRISSFGPDLFPCLDQNCLSLFDLRFFVSQKTKD
jgi:hypothetical protein